MISNVILDSAKSIQATFQSARPFKHVYLQDFLEPDIAEALLRDFPTFDRDKALNEFGEVGGKAVNTRLRDISLSYQKLYDYLFSEQFLHAMVAISGIPDLIGDASLFGGGTHENLNGQQLDPHVDFNYVQGGGAHRRMNLLIYLNKGWVQEWGGAIELHSNPRDPESNKIAAFNVDFNKALLFETNEYSWHGFPRICLPPELSQTHSRKCISIYLYTKSRPAEEIAGTHATFYVQRPLAERFKAGYSLTEQDALELRANYRGRDRYIEYYQIQEERFGRRLEELESAAAARAVAMIPIIGFAKEPTIRSGRVWSDGWAAQQFSLDLKAVRALTRIELRVRIPDSAPYEKRQLVMEAGGTRESFEISGRGSFAFAIPLKVSADESFTFAVECDRTFNLSTINGSDDIRDLAFHIEQVLAE
jgi:hypothetical protein